MIIRPQYIDQTELPMPEGTHDGGEVYGRDVHVGYNPGRWSLTGLAKDHVLYSPAVLGMIGLPADPVAIFWSENNLPPQDAPYIVDVGRTILKGMTPPFDRVLFACPGQHAARLIAFLDRVSVRNEEGRVYQSVRQRIPVVDWPLLRTVSVAPLQPPTVQAELYGVHTPESVFHWVPSADPWNVPVQFTRRDHAAAPKRYRGQRS